MQANQLVLMSDNHDWQLRSFRPALGDDDGSVFPGARRLYRFDDRVGGRDHGTAGAVEGLMRRTRLQLQGRMPQ